MSSPVSIVSALDRAAVKGPSVVVDSKNGLSSCRELPLLALPECMTFLLELVPDFVATLKSHPISPMAGPFSARLRDFISSMSSRRNNSDRNCADALFSGEVKIRQGSLQPGIRRNIGNVSN